MHSKKEPKHTIQELQQWQALPLSIKVRMTKQRIRDWINYYGENGVYVSFSGGKDSTVLLDLVRQEYPNVVAVFVDTGLEFPEIRQFVKLFDNVEWVKPKMTFRQVIEKYGYPFISKEISNMCCYVMKKSPAKEYEKRTGKWAFTAMMASESKLRTSAWLKDGCNGFDRKHPMSNPMAFWTEQDVLLYLRENHDRMLAPLKERNPELKHPWVSVYGEILTDDEESGQVSLFDGNALDAGLFDFDRPELHTTGENRTGCMFCGFGCHIRKNDGRFERMKVSHPKIYKYLFGGEWSYRVFSHDGSEIDLRHVDKEMLKRWVVKNQENRRFKIVWKTPPKGGLGYADVIDWINEHGNLDIKY